MPDINKEYQKKHLKNIAQNVKNILGQYGDAIYEIALIAELMTYKGQTFSLSKYPLLNSKVQLVLSDLSGSIYSTIVNSIKNSWDLSNEKNNLIVDKRIFGTMPPSGNLTPSGRALSGEARQILYDPNLEALNQFIARKTNGLSLSQRVWNSVQPFYNQLEQGLAIGISEGQPASEMASNLKQYLKNPDKLFRRVKDSEGNLQLSKAAQNYRPGQGVYRSSYKNALRLTATETNMAYRTSDNLRWQSLPFVLGQQIHLSNSHAKCDVCDNLQGQYPSDFNFVGWHPFCICYATPVLMSNSQYSQYEDQILGIGALDESQVNYISSPPKAFDDFVAGNEETLQRQKPYWYTGNKQYV